MSDLLRPVSTNDGSSTLFSTVFGSHYHSMHGSKNESLHVFIDKGLHYFIGKHQTKREISILEYGFGTGLNAILTQISFNDQEKSCYYKSIEAYPIAISVIHLLNFNLTISEQAVFEKIHDADWDKDVSITTNFQLHKSKSHFEEFSDTRLYDIIYYDAFGPGSQPELWDEDQMKKCYELLQKDGILVTFSAKGSFRRALKSVGFEVEKLQGPPGKREMTRAMKK